MAKLLILAIILIGGCAIQPKKVSSVKLQRARAAFIEARYIDYCLRQAEKEFGL